MSQKPLLYFGHPVNTYNTELERALLKEINEKFRSVDIENPNQPHHQENYRRWKEEFGNGMNYYYQRVLPNCWGGIFLPFRNGDWGAGVYGEAEFFFKLKCLIWKIEDTGENFEITPITRLNLEKKLSIEETRVRTKLPY